LEGKGGRGLGWLGVREKGVREMKFRFFWGLERGEGGLELLAVGSVGFVLEIGV
jgi:hypothetical protein